MSLASAGVFFSPEPPEKPQFVVICYTVNLNQLLRTAHPRDRRRSPYSSWLSGVDNFPMSLDCTYSRIKGDARVLEKTLGRKTPRADLSRDASEGSKSELGENWRLWTKSGGSKRM